MWLENLLHDDDFESDSDRSPIKTGLHLKKFKELKLGLQVEMNKWCSRCLGLGSHTDCEPRKSKGIHGIGSALIHEIDSRLSSPTKCQGIEESMTLPHRKQLYL